MRSGAARRTAIACPVTAPNQSLSIQPPLPRRFAIVSHGLFRLVCGEPQFRGAVKLRQVLQKNRGERSRGLGGRNHPCERRWCNGWLHNENLLPDSVLNIAPLIGRNQPRIRVGHPAVASKPLMVANAQTTFAAGAFPVRGEVHDNAVAVML
jgi:hypothetical protein